MRPEDPRDLETRARALRCALAADRVILAGARFSSRWSGGANFDPAQPRDDHGAKRRADDRRRIPSTIRTRWPTRCRRTSGYGWPGRSIRADRFARRGRADGAHAIGEHVGKSDEKLLARVRGDAWFGFTLDVVRFRDGSFSSLESANSPSTPRLAEMPTSSRMLPQGEDRMPS